MLASLRRILLIAIASSFVSLPAARGAVLAADPIDYPDGPLLGQSGGTGWVGIWTGFRMNVSGGEAVATADDQCTGYRTFINPAATSQLFFAFDLRVPPAYGLNDYLGMNLRLGVNQVVMAAGKVVGSNSFVVVGGNGEYVETGIAPQPGAVYRVVGAYDISHDLACVWIDPDGADYFDPTTGANSSDASIEQGQLVHADWIDFEASRVGTGLDAIVIGDAPAAVGLGAGSPAEAVDPIVSASGFTLAPPVPNPAGGTTRVQFRLPRESRVRALIYDATGREVARIADRVFPAGRQEVTWARGGGDATVAPGVYFVRVEMDEGGGTVKLVVAD